MTNKAMNAWNAEMPPINLYNMPQGTKYDKEKPKMDLLDWSALEGLALGLTFGANKYGSHNWRSGINNSRLIASLLRHLAAIQRGEDVDPESGLPHIDLVGCNWMFLSFNYKQRPDLDDRPADNSVNAGIIGNERAIHSSHPVVSEETINLIHNWFAKEPDEGY